jgi:hypothetical protein
MVNKIRLGGYVVRRAGLSFTIEASSMGSSSGVTPFQGCDTVYVCVPRVPLRFTLGYRMTPLWG